MKNCDEMVNSLLERRNQYVAEQKRKRKMITRTATSMCCLSLVALLGFGMWQGGMFDEQTPAVLDNSADIENKGNTEPDMPNNGLTQESQNDETSKQSDIDSRKFLFAINKINKTVNPAPPYRDPDLHYNEIWDFNKSVYYLGVNIPEAVNAVYGDSYLKPVNNNEFTVTFKNGGTIVEDRMCYAFVGVNDAKITILASKLKPPYDCIYYSDTKNTTAIGIPETNENVTVLVYSKDKSLFVVDFEYNGTYYRITTENIEKISLLNTLVLEIVK